MASSFEYTSPEQTAQINYFFQDAKTPSSDLQARYTQDLMAKNPLGDYNSTLEAGTDDIKKQIADKALRGYRATIGAKRNEMELMALNDRFRRLTNAARLVNAEHQHNAQVRMNKYAEKVNRKRAKGQVLGNVLGIVGAGAGLFAGNPALGASVGYQLGQGVGNVAGGN